MIEIKEQTNLIDLTIMHAIKLTYTETKRPGYFRSGTRSYKEKVKPRCCFLQNDLIQTITLYGHETNWVGEYFQQRFRVGIHLYRFWTEMSTLELDLLTERTLENFLPLVVKGWICVTCIVQMNSIPIFNVVAETYSSGLICSLKTRLSKSLAWSTYLPFDFKTWYTQYAIRK